MVFCRVSMALRKGGQTNLTVNQMKMAKATAWEIRVRLMFFEPLAERLFAVIRVSFFE